MVLPFDHTHDFDLVQTTPVISRQLGAKIRERELSGSPIISRFRAKAQTRDFQDQSPTLWRLHLLNPNSMLRDNGCTYISQGKNTFSPATCCIFCHCYDGICSTKAYTTDDNQINFDNQESHFWPGTPLLT